jgi:hypothetical protein
MPHERPGVLIWTTAGGGVAGQVRDGHGATVAGWAAYGTLIEIAPTSG